MRIFFIGDIIGRPGRIAVKELLPDIIEKHAIDLVIANGENAAGGFGITPAVAEELIGLKIDVITSGNHIWDKKEIIDYIRDKKWLLRPANYPEGVPGFGWTVLKTNGETKVGILNLCGRVFMDNLDCPFRVGGAIIKEIMRDTNIIILDMHAETTSEKAAMGWFLDGKISAVIGTHTHVQTADERILPQGTAFISDAGMTGSLNSVIGMQKEIVLERFLTQMPKKFEVAAKDIEMQGVIVSISSETGKAATIERIKAVL
ncbi:MAG: TIGR00282 family metallophosphoesterase [Deltaproteobacteria bacterium]|nr:TIGR00282 family metallophosphoesterase [Deltaproteobacteria bacterium]MBI3755641.1 TIGR00282 family metallophosphoesterase [Deltaproteobacteria bacterium]